MTEEKKLDNNTVEKSVSVSASPNAKKAPPKDTSKPDSKPSKKLALTAIVISLLTAGGGFYYVNQENQALKEQLALITNQLQSTEQKVAQQLSDNQQQSKILTNEAMTRAEVMVAQQQTSIESLQQAMTDMTGRRPNDWLLAEADYLVKLAGRKLFLEHDVITATHLMESADQRIATLNDPSLVPLRQAMANDITKLRSLPLLDKDGVALQLISLQQQVDSLPLANAILPDAPVETKTEVSSDIQDWKTNISTSLENFAEQFITFRVRDGSAIPLLSPQQHFYLRENIKSKLQTAINSTYSEKTEIYQSSLKVALEWSKTYLNQDEKSVQEFNKALNTLSKIEVDLAYPNKLQTEPMLSDVIKERLRREVTTIITEDK
jgi:uroporphyrin-3 C-methyltransferase